MNTLGDGVQDEAFRDLVLDASPRLLRTAYLLTGDWGRAEDLLQSALTTTWLHWPSLRDSGAAEAYVRRVLVTTSGKWWRRRWHGEVPTGELPESGYAAPYSAIDDRDGLRRALSKLSWRQRAVLVLRYYDDASEAETAALLGCSVDTVKSTASRALRQLRESGVVTDAARTGAARPAPGAAPPPVAATPRRTSPATPAWEQR